LIFTLAPGSFAQWAACLSAPLAGQCSGTHRSATSGAGIAGKPLLGRDAVICADTNLRQKLRSWVAMIKVPARFGPVSFGTNDSRPVEVRWVELDLGRAYPMG
jgi:hypothetical protein